MPCLSISVKIRETNVLGKHLKRERCNYFELSFNEIRLSHLMVQNSSYTFP